MNFDLARCSGCQSDQFQPKKAARNKDGLQVKERVSPQVALYMSDPRVL